MRSVLALAAIFALTPLAAGFAPFATGPGSDAVSGPVTMNFITGFTPPVVVVAAGGSVTWQNPDAVVHTATSFLGGPPDSGNMLRGASYTATFSAQGVSVYRCLLHPWMVGAVVVT